MRIPNDGKTYPLPPGLGNFPIYKASDFSRSLPEQWCPGNSFFIPMYQCEALWLAFTAVDWKPNAVKVDIGKVNAVSGNSDTDYLQDNPQNYIVCPRQPWLDGINSGKGCIRQFVAMPLGLGLTVEAYVTGKEEYGAIQIKVYEAKADVFPEQPPKPKQTKSFRPVASSATTMGLAVGGQMKQKIYPDPYGLDVWDKDNFGDATIHIVNSELFEQICGQQWPSSPIDTKTYTQNGFPWFSLYDESQPDLAAPEVFTKIKSLDDADDFESIDILDQQIKKLGKTSD